MAYGTYYPRTCLKGLRKATESVKSGQSVTGYRFWAGPLEYKAGRPTTQPWHLENINFKNNQSMNTISNHSACFHFQYFTIFYWLYKWCLGHMAVWSWVVMQTDVVCHMLQVGWLLDYLIIMHQWLYAGSCEHGNESLGSINYGKFN
jgi:hypothetical protein